MADASIPRHVAIIMDGNGRWAKRRLLPRAAGHKAGVDAVRKTVRAAKELGLEALTLYAFSSENWKRPEDEISDLMGLMKRFILSDLDNSPPRTSSSTSSAITARSNPTSSR